MKAVEFYRMFEYRKDERSEYKEHTKIFFPHKSVFIISPYVDFPTGGKWCYEITIWSLIWNSIWYSIKYPYYHLVWWFVRFSLKKGWWDGRSIPEGEMFSWKKFFKGLDI